MDDNIGYVLKKLEDMGQLDNTIVVFTTDNGAETETFPDGGTTPFKGGSSDLGRRHARSLRDPLAGTYQAWTVFNDIFASLDWVPTFVEIAGGPKGDGLKKQIEAGKYPGIIKTTLDGVNQIDYLTGKSDKSARDNFLYYSGKQPSAVRYKNWKMYFAMVSDLPPDLSMAWFPMPGPRSSTSSAIVRDYSWFVVEDTDGRRRRHRRADDRLSI